MGMLSTPPRLHEASPSWQSPCIGPAGGLPRGRSRVLLEEDSSEMKLVARREGLGQFC